MGLTLFKRNQLLPIAVFLVTATLATFVCYLGGQMTYLAPLMASAAVLANAGAAVKPVVRATLFAYSIYLLLAGAANLWIPAMPVQLVLLCAIGFLLGMVLLTQHPPALALLAALFMHPADIFATVWLAFSVLAMLAGVVSVHQLHQRWIAGIE